MRSRTRSTAAMLACSLALIAIVHPISGPRLAAQERHATGKASAPRESIKVNGAWTIDVRDPDGRLVTHREFSNHLAPSGPESLANLLNGAGKVGGWSVSMFRGMMTSDGRLVEVGLALPSGDSLGSPCTPRFERPETTRACRITTLSENPTLQTDTADGGLILTGSLTATESGIITAVRVGPQPQHRERPNRSGEGRHQLFELT